MQDIKPTQIAQPQATETDTQTVQPAYVPPKITVYKEEELFQTVTVLGCYVQAE